MGRSRMLWLAVAGTILAVASPETMAQETAAEPARDFSTIHAQLCRKEKWETVVWKTDFREAHAASVKEQKPIFIWAMDGQTLGCT